MAEKFSVLMSLYAKEKPEYFRQALESVLCQSMPPDEIVIVKDGPLTEGLEQVISEYRDKAPELYTIVPLETNRGLGFALAEGITHCRYELVARMDTDDVSMPDRFEKQLAAFESDPLLDICGGQILEFEGEPENIVAVRRVPLADEEIKRYQKRRDAFNHMTVMYKKSSVLRAGNYRSALLMEDTLLWVNMILIGAKCRNLDCCLVYVRIGLGMYERRGGLDYYKKYRLGRKAVRKTGYISAFDHYYTLAVQFAVAVMPNKLRGFVYKKLLHR